MQLKFHGLTAKLAVIVLPIVKTKKSQFLQIFLNHDLMISNLVANTFIRYQKMQIQRKQALEKNNIDRKPQKIESGSCIHSLIYSLGTFFPMLDF